MLDAGPLGRLAHPRASPEIVKWVQQLSTAGVKIVLPEVAEYEVRRSLLLNNLTRSVERLDQLKEVLTYWALNTDAMLQAAELWAEVRKSGRPTADSHALDGDVILAAQALQVGAIVATENIGHLPLFVDARDWKAMLAE